MKNLAEATQTITRLTADLKAKTDKCNSLSLDNHILKVQSGEREKKLVTAEDNAADLSRKLMALHIQYTRSVRARESAANAWIAYREKSEACRSKAIRCLLTQMTVLWRYSRFLAGQNARASQNSLLAKADLAVARTKYHNLQARYDALLIDYEQSCDNNIQLETRARAQAEELTSLQTVHETLRLLNQQTTAQIQETALILKETVTKYDLLHSDHADLMCRHEILEARVKCAEDRCQQLEQGTLDLQRASGLSLGLMARHVHLERVRMEEDKIRGFRPVYDMMLDLRSRLAVADEYVQKMVREPRIFVLDTPSPRGALPTPPDSVRTTPSPLTFAHERHMPIDPFVVKKSTCTSGMVCSALYRRLLMDLTRNITVLHTDPSVVSTKSQSSLCASTDSSVSFFPSFFMYAFRLCCAYTAARRTTPQMLTL